MNFEMSDDQKMLVDTARTFARKTSPVSRFRAQRERGGGFDRAVWQQMGELGWLGAPFPESVGGFGGRFIDAALVIDQLARSLVPEPYLASAIAGGWPLWRLGSAEQHRRWLAPLVAGDSVVSLAVGEEGWRYRPEAIRTRAVDTGAGHRLDGSKRWVLVGDAADVFVVSAQHGDGISLFVIDRDTAGVSVQAVPTMDALGAAMVELRGVEVAPDRLLGGAGQGLEVLEDTLDAASAASVMEASGIAVAVLEMTVEYLKTREQFGAPIGSFQVLQHRAVDMFIQSQLLSSLAIEACLRIDEGGREERRAAVSAAKVQLARGGRDVVRLATQLHGGIGVTEEHDIGLYFKRMQVLSTLFGDEAHHVERFASISGFDT